MPWLKKQLPFLLLLLLVYGSYFFTHVPTPVNHTQILGADTNLTLFTQPESGQAPIVTALDNAQKEVLMEMYLLSDKQIIASLENAASRGVKVVVMLEEHPFGGGNLNTKTASELKSHGVQVGWSSPDYALTHQKSIIIDQTYVFILNQNLTVAASSKNREYNIIDTNLEDVQEVRNIFIADWQRKTYIPKRAHLLVSPINSRDTIANLATTSVQTIDIEAEVITDPKIVTLLTELAKTRHIRLITPTLSQISSNEDSLRELKNIGVNVRVLSSPYMHAKLIITDSKKAYIGSVNLTTQSMDENRELGIILTDQTIIQTLLKTYEADWEKAKPL
jgi:phosphatidylserine/phosphatidylglycerophosphate/cardiolipin synthase-like enzyme